MKIPRILRAAALATAFLVPCLSRAAVLNVPAGSSQTQIQAVIDSASAGDTVSFAAGDYLIASPLAMKNGIVIEGNDCIWDATASTSLVNAIDAANLLNFTIRNLFAKNIRFNFYNASGSSYLRDIAITNVRFADGKGGVDAHYIALKAENVTINGCRFLRTSAFPGKGVSLYLCKNSTITNCLFGATATDGADSATHGWFKTAINVNNSATGGGETTDTFITGNRAFRAAAMDGATQNCDHGYYLLGFNRLIVSDNTIAGWPPTPSGGAIKLRQGQYAMIENNTFKDSGVILYVYDNNPLRHLRHTLVRNNSFQTSAAVVPADMYHGVGYWRSYATAEPAEYSIRVEGNTLVNGRIQMTQTDLQVDNVNANGGGVFNNTIYNGSIALTAGVAQSGNIIHPDAPPPPPTAPTGLAATAVSPTRVDLAWTASADATSYTVKASPVGGGPYSAIATNLANPSHSDTAAAPGATTYYVVSAANGGGESADSAEASVTTPALPPPAPTALSATGAKGKINLAWTQSTGANVVTNKLYRATTNGGPYALIASFPAKTSHSDATSRGATYRYVVTAVNASGAESAVSNQASAASK